MKHSELKHKIEIMKLKHKHEIELIKAKQEMELKGLISECKHKYDDGTSAIESEGVYWNSYEACKICGTVK